MPLVDITKKPFSDALTGAEGVYILQDGRLRLIPLSVLLTEVYDARKDNADDSGTQPEYDSLGTFIRRLSSRLSFVEDSSAGTSAVDSVNGQTGTVQLPVSGFGTCSTHGAIEAKDISGVNDEFVVKDGSILQVKFSAANTAAAPKLRVKGVEAPIYDKRTGSYVEANAMGAQIHQFAYFAGAWVLLDPVVVAGTGNGNVSSQEVSTLKVLDQAEYDALSVKDPSTLYLIRG